MASSSLSASQEFHPPAQISPYEQLRLDKIARNHKRLASLGLASPILQSVGAGAGAGKMSKKRSSTSRNKAVPREGERKSKRIKGVKPATTISEGYAVVDSLDKHAAGVETTSPRKKKLQSRSNNGGDALDADVVSVPAKVASGGRVSVQDMSVDLNEVVKTSLNKQMPETGKYNVVDLIASTSKTSYSEPVYNKYPGSLFFKNAAVLFMNFDRRGGGDYVNDFEKNGEFVNWYASVKVNVDSPTVANLKRFGKVKGGHGGIIVFTRFMDGSKSEPYVCLGRVSYVSHDSGSRPIKFKFKFTDVLDEGAKMKFVKF
ncbi:hypothetical protein TrVE_jg2809 [Triparma verrucosa]|uniref:Uncharacterized protein n=1 Tax=Triparma verrucosa TaxID=1606542 RepID=A0A9W7ER44_9STRA|nr:hypothetical protein TrVE_jg2809 [Triparma verrucosa]